MSEQPYDAYAVRSACLAVSLREAGKRSNAAGDLSAGCVAVAGQKVAIAGRCGRGLHHYRMASPKPLAERLLAQPMPSLA